MILILENPTKLRVQFESEEELTKAKKDLTYMDTSVAYQIKMTKDSAYKYGEAWAANRVFELESDLKPCLLFSDGDGYFTRPGVIKYLQNRFDCKFTNQVNYPEFHELPWEKDPKIVFNDPNFEAHRAQKEALERMLVNPHSHVEHATGTGKSYLIELLIKNTGLPTIVSTPSRGIARAMYNECIALFGKRRVGLFGDGKREIGKHILICVGKSLSLVKDTEELEQFKKYQVFISDESHTLPADQFEYFCHNILGHCPYRWFVSGSQERTDGSDLKLLSIIGPQIHYYSIEQAIEDRVLAKLSFLIFNLNSSVYFDSSNAVRMNQEHLYKNERIASIISDVAYEAVTNNMPVLILIDEHVQEKILQAYMKVEFTYASGKSEVEKICKDFNAGKIMCVVGNSAASTGTNFKPNRFTINWRAGKSIVKTKQGPIGRSTRIDKRTGKTECKVLDFRINNVRKLRNHANKRIECYKQVGKVEYVDLDVPAQDRTS